ncbi:MFS transporter [Streptomyces sp. CoH27]|uniref:MFS transporter n=1 Tax=Streptomyces sp. CoH27 TaxID=2875763 RepID=UPI001CD7F1A6|nr:MFS transporter [Streptomyces sp. CoH27]
MTVPAPTEKTAPEETAPELADQPTTSPPPHPRLITLLAAACGLIAACLYYCQPLLPRIADSYGASPSAAGALVTATQAGYTLGLLLIVPLGDIVARRRLIAILLGAAGAGMLLSGAAPALWVLQAGGFAVGAGAVVIQILIPYAASIVPADQRGRAMATLLTGVLLGILCSRTAAGLLGGAFGWRTVFLAAAGTLAAVALLLVRLLPPSPPDVSLGYGAQLAATLRLAAAEPVLRRRSLIGACCFAAFSVFWATSAFLLAGPHYGWSTSAIGLFALVGAAGAIAAKATGRIVDTGREAVATGVLLALGVAAFAALWPGGRSLVWLVAGVLVLDVVVHGVHLLNMSVVYDLPDHPRARIASVYMTSYYLGGAAGSAIGVTAYRFGGWGAVPATGAALLAVALVVWAVGLRRRT